MSRKKVVLVCMVDSIHVARWIAQFDASEVQFILFPSSPNRLVHSKIKKLMVENGNISVAPFGGKLSIPLWGLDLLFSDYVRGLLLRRVIKRSSPDFVHALELQHGGYITIRALEDSSLTTTFIATNYGSDIYWFQQFPKHLAKIKKLLARADRYSAECQRDVDLAQKYGFFREVLPVIPNAGGIDRSYLELPLDGSSDRKLILIKGYDGWVGRAGLVAKCLPLIREDLKGMSLMFYSCNSRTVRQIRKISRTENLEISYSRKGRLTHEEMINLFSKSLVHVGISLSDGISTAVIEAKAMGAYPVQTDSSCASEWFRQIEQVRTSSLSAETVADGIARAVATAKILTGLQVREIPERLDPGYIKRLAQKWYEK